MDTVRSDNTAPTDVLDSTARGYHFTTEKGMEMGRGRRGRKGRNKGNGARGGKGLAPINIMNIRRL